jgi:tripartite-type tricarboxylate transporter receptor subunit TctC
LTTCTVASAVAGQYPERPLKLIVPTTAGSVPDVVARLVADRLAAALGQAVVVDNRPGGGGLIGMQAIARSAPDGYTLGLQTLPFVVMPSLVANASYDPQRDLQPVTLLNWNYVVLAVRASSPFRTIGELITRAKADPGALTFASSGNATPSHLTLALLEQQTGARFTHVPYKGGPAARTALLAGDVDVFGSSVDFAAAQVRAGAVRALATSAPQRMESLPEVPTLVEAGYPGVELRDWQGIVVPAETPRPIVERLHAELERILSTPDVREHFARLGLLAAGFGPEAFADQQRADIVKWHALARAARITAD